MTLDLVINDSISVVKVPLEGSDKKQKRILFTFRGVNGAVLEVYTPHLPIQRAERVLSWELGSLGNAVEIDPEFLKKAKQDPYQEILEYKNGGIGFKPKTISVKGFNRGVIKFPKLYGDSEFTSDKREMVDIDTPEFWEWARSVFIPRAKKLEKSLSEKSDGEIIRYAREEVKKRKGHLTHIGLLTWKNGEIDGHIGTTYQQKGTLEIMIGEQSFNFSLHHFSPTKKEIEERYSEFQKALVRKGSERQHVYRRFGIKVDDEEGQKRNIKDSLAAMALVKWANNFVNEFYAYIVIGQYCGVDIEQWKHAPTMRASEKPWADWYNRTPRMSRMIEVDEEGNENEFFLKERFPNAVVLDTFYLAFNCLPQLRAKYLDAICAYFGIPRRKGIISEYYNYYNLLVEMGDKEVEQQITKYLAEDVAVPRLLAIKLWPQINSLLKISEATGIPLKQLTLRREALEELADKNYYHFGRRHRLPEIAFIGKEEWSNLKQRTKDYRKVSYRKQGTLADHYVYVPWPLFIEEELVGYVPQLKKVFDLYKASFQDKSQDPLTYIRHIEPLAVSLLARLLYIEELSEKYNQDLAIVGATRDKVRNIHRPFDNFDGSSKIQGTFKRALSLLEGVMKETEEESSDRKNGDVTNLSVFREAKGIANKHYKQQYEKYQTTVKDCVDAIPDQIKERLKELNIEADDFLFLNRERRYLRLMCKRLHWRGGLLESLTDKIRAGYDEAIAELGTNFQIVKQRGDLLELFAFPRADPTKLRKVIYLGPAR